MPFPDSQNPEDYGWGPANKSGEGVDPYFYNGYEFASGSVAWMEMFNNAIGDAMFSETTMDTRVEAPLTKKNQSNWNFWGWNYRAKRGSDNLSLHSWPGIALDWNSSTNPFDTSNPETGQYQISSNTQEKLDAVFGAGMVLWGGAWGDFMHTEVHGTPSECRAWILANTHPDNFSVLDFIMSLPGTPANTTYQTFLHDLAHAVVTYPLDVGGTDVDTTIAKVLPNIIKTEQNTANIVQDIKNQKTSAK